MKWRSWHMSLQRSVTFYSHSSVINQQGRVALVGFSFSKASLYFCCILVCQCWWNTAHRNLTLPYWTIVRRTSKHFFKISKTYLYVTSMSPRDTQHLLHLWSIWWEFGFFSSCWELDEKVGITVMSEQTGNERKWVTHRCRHLLMSFSSFYIWLTHLDWIVLFCDSNNGHTLQINFPFYSHWLETIGWGHRAEREPRAVFP